jgi:hypothetical protein
VGREPPPAARGVFPAGRGASSAGRGAYLRGRKPSPTRRMAHLLHGLQLPPSFFLLPALLLLQGISRISFSCLAYGGEELAMEPDRAGLKRNRAYEMFRGRGRETLREDLPSPPSPLCDDHVADGHSNYAQDRATTPNGHAHVRATTATPTLGR